MRPVQHQRRPAQASRTGCGRRCVRAPQGSWTPPGSVSRRWAGSKHVLGRTSSWVRLPLRRSSLAPGRGPHSHECGLNLLGRVPCKSRSSDSAGSTRRGTRTPGISPPAAGCFPPCHRSGAPSHVPCCRPAWPGPQASVRALALQRTAKQHVSRVAGPAVGAALPAWAEAQHPAATAAHGARRRPALRS